MYYIEQEIGFQSGINIINYGFHYISRYQIDFANGTTEIQVSSAVSKEQWLSDNCCCPYVTMYELDSIPNFSSDPVHFILKCLVTKNSTLFYKAEVVRDWDIENLTTLKSQIKDGSFIDNPDEVM